MNNAQSQSLPSSEQPIGPQRKKFNFWRLFWLSTIPISLGWLWHDFYAPENHITWAKDYASAEQQSVKSGKPMILFFTGTWCSPCRIMKREVWADRQVEAAVNSGFTPVTIDVDDPRAATVKNRYRVGITPTTIVTDPKGNVLQYATGGIDKSHFLGMLAKADPSATKVRAQ
jgi:protein disulfide-isomerase